MIACKLRSWTVWGLLLASMPAMGNEIRLIPMVTVKQEYNSNIFFDPTQKMEDYITTLSPGLKLENNTERLKLEFSARLDQRLYAHNSNLNATDHAYLGRVRYEFSPTLRLAANAGFIQDSSPDRDIETTGVVQSAVTRNRQIYGLSGDYYFTEKTQASLSGEYFQDRYAYPRSIDDLDAGRGNLMLIHDISSLLPATRARVGLGYARYLYTASTVENYTGTVGLSRQFSEVWYAQVDMGCRYTPSQFEVAPLQTVETSGWGAVGNVVVSYRGEKTNMDLSLNHDIAPTSGRAIASELTGLGLYVRRRFFHEFSGILSGGYFLNNYTPGESSNLQLDEKTLYISPGIRYDFTPDMALDATYTYTRTDYARDNDNVANQSLVLVRFYLQNPLFE
jgi:hypothetical protein